MNLESEDPESASLGHRLHVSPAAENMLALFTGDQGIPAQQ